MEDRLAGKRVLLVLDDATGSDQVQPLLPGTASTLVLVTSRRRLSALADAVPLTLEPLEAGDATVLFVRLSLRPGLQAADQGIARIIALCDYLPLAIRLMAGKLKYRATWSTSDLAAGSCFCLQPPRLHSGRERVSSCGTQPLVPGP